MKYPKDIGPQSQTEALAILFTMLGNAYNVLAQYEAEDHKREDEERRAFFEQAMPVAVCIQCGRQSGHEADCPNANKRQTVFRSEGAHREDEQQ